MPRRKGDVPYSSATTGAKAREEVLKILTKFGCQSIGFMDDLENHQLILAFRHRGRDVQLKASAKGWAALLLKNTRKPNGVAQAVHEKRALDQGMIAVNSILRDWVKGQVTAVETGVMSFEAVFFAHMLAPDGRTLLSIAEDKKMIQPPRESAA